MHPARDHALPPDPTAYRAARHPRGRVIVIAPTRAACETIELALGVHVDTVLAREHGATLHAWAEAGTPFGIVAGTGTGKTLAIRPIAEAILQESLRYGVVNREREATPETPTWNVVIITTGIARRWFQDDLITAADTVVVDEIHQTSAELELCLALGKRAGVRYIWLSATVDPAFYAKYLESREVLETSAFDPALAATVRVVPKDPKEFLDEKAIRRIIRDKRGVAVFVPTRKEVEMLARDLREKWPKLNVAYYHGGEPIRAIRPFLEGEVEKPFLLTMTAAGQSALNLPGLDTVVIYDARYGNVVDRGRNVLHRLYLGANEILQMAGRVHGRVAKGEVTILSDRALDFAALRPTPPEFQLAGDAERVAITCASIGVDATELDLPVALDKVAYRRAVRLLSDRGLIAAGRLTDYGREVEALPVERPWAELLVRAEPGLVPLVAVAANIDSLHRMTRDERELHGVVANGSDHLTAYNLYAEAVNQHGILGQVYGLPRHLFEPAVEEWAERRGVLLKSVEDAALGTAAVYRALELPLPATLPYADKELRDRFAVLLAEVMPFDLVIDEHTADGQEARISRSSMAGAWGAVAGNLRYFADRFGTPRASIEGTTLGYDLVRRFAKWGEPRVLVTGPRRKQRLAVERRRHYFGFELETGMEPLEGEIPAELRAAARTALADGLLEGGLEHPDQGKIRREARSARELYLRSGGGLAALSDAALRELLVAQLQEVDSWTVFERTPVLLDLGALVPAAERAALEALPATVRLKGDTVPIEYEIDRNGDAVARLRLREGQARQLTMADLPPLDRPTRFVVARGDDPPILADSLPGLQAELRKPRPHRKHLQPDRDDGRHRGGGRGAGGPRGRGGKGPGGRRGGKRH